MTVRPRLPPARAAARFLLAAALGALTAVLVSCSGSGRSLIPSANAGPLKSDFEAIAQAAQSGNGSCADTEAALARAERDLAALPVSVDAGLRKRLREGLARLRTQSLEQCAQPPAQSSQATSSPTTTSTQTTTPPPSTETSTTPSTSSTATTAPPEPGGGTPAPGEGGGQGEPPEGSAKNGKGPGEGESAHFRTGGPASGPPVGGR